MSGNEFLASCAFVLLVAVIATAQSAAFCILDQPLPKLPGDYGTLDAQTSVIFRVEFLPNATIGKTALVKSSRIPRLDELGREAVSRIVFRPQMVDGVAVSANKVLQYRYSWVIPGWKVIRLGEKSYCPKSKQ